MIDNAALEDLIGDFAARPLTNRAFGHLWLLAGQGHNLADLIGSDPARRTRPGQILQALGNAELRQRNRLQIQPAPPPQSCRVNHDSQSPGDLGVVLPFASRQYNAGPQRYLLLCAVAFDQLLKTLPLSIGQTDGGWLGTFHNAHLRLQQDTCILPAQPPAVNRRSYRGAIHAQMY